MSKGEWYIVWKLLSPRDKLSFLCPIPKCPELKEIAHCDCNYNIWKLHLLSGKQCCPQIDKNLQAVNQRKWNRKWICGLLKLFSFYAFYPNFCHWKLKEEKTLMTTGIFDSIHPLQQTSPNKTLQTKSILPCVSKQLGEIKSFKYTQTMLVHTSPFMITWLLKVFSWELFSGLWESLAETVTYLIV